MTGVDMRFCRYLYFTSQDQFPSDLTRFPLDFQKSAMIAEAWNRNIRKIFGGKWKWKAPHFLLFLLGLLFQLTKDRWFCLVFHCETCHLIKSTSKPKTFNQWQHWTIPIVRSLWLKRWSYKSKAWMIKLRYCVVMSLRLRQWQLLSPLNPSISQPRRRRKLLILTVPRWVRV